METREQHELHEGTRCVICGRYFQPHHRGSRQITCLDSKCRKQRKRAQEKEWLERYRKDHGKSYFSGDYERIRDWREAHPGYQSEWRAKRRGVPKGGCSAEIHNAQLPENPIKPLLLRLRIPSTLRLSEIQTLNLRLTRSGSDFWVDGAP